MDQTSLQESVLAYQAHYRSQYEQFTPYAEYFDLRGTEFLLMALRLRRLFEPLRWGRVLEVGSGNGFGCLLWGLLAEHVVGVDGAGETETAKRLVAASPGHAEHIRYEEGACEDLSGVEGIFDLVVTQYALEHFRDADRSLREIHSHVAPGGHAIHIVPNAANRHKWYIEYRSSLRWWNRVKHSLRYRGRWMTLKDPFGYTAPHDGTRGTFEEEMRNYTLEHWAELILRNDAVIVDYFPTRDLNWVIVSQPLAVQAA